MSFFFVTYLRKKQRESILVADDSLDFLTQYIPQRTSLNKLTRSLSVHLTCSALMDIGVRSDNALTLLI